MKKVGAAMTAFFAVVVLTGALGWRWAGSLPPAKAAGARAVLVLGSVASLAAIAVIWRSRSVPPSS
ncbi:MAG TPA: hypothetical protein VFE31_05070 [Opitutaceae bacterium]|nr:hypothetical protein [Opitutaceae bacterium]